GWWMSLGNERRRRGELQHLLFRALGEPASDRFFLSRIDLSIGASAARGCEDGRAAACATSLSARITKKSPAQKGAAGERPNKRNSGEKYSWIGDAFRQHSSSQVSLTEQAQRETERNRRVRNSIAHHRHAGRDASTEG